jgi:hypothetical protein
VKKPRINKVDDIVIENGVKTLQNNLEIMKDKYLNDMHLQKSSFEENKKKKLERKCNICLFSK